MKPATVDSHLEVAAEALREVLPAEIVDRVMTHIGLAIAAAVISPQTDHGAGWRTIRAWSERARR